MMTEQDQKNLRKVLIFAVLSLLLHFLAVIGFYRFQRDQLAALPPPPPKQEVVWVNPQDTAPPSIPVVSAKNLQLADIAKPKQEMVPQKTRFASKYNSSVKDETVGKVPKNARLDSENSEDGQKGDNAKEAGPVPPQPPKQVAMKEPSPPQSEKTETPPEAAKKEEAPPKDISLSDLSLKPADFKDLVPKESKDKKDSRIAMKEPTSKGENYVSPLRGRPGLSGEPDNFVNDFFPDVKIGGKTYLNTAAFPDVQYFTQLKRIFRLRFNPVTPLRQYLAGNRIVVGKVNVSMAVSVSANGQLKELFVIKSSGIPGYDEEAMRTIRESAPFSAPPTKVMDKDGVLRMNWNFITYL